MFLDLSLKFALKDYNLVSWEARFRSTNGFSGSPSASLSDFGCVGAQSF
jgi:hypothetical protein